MGDFSDIFIAKGNINTYEEMVEAVKQQKSKKFIKSLVIIKNYVTFDVIDNFYFNFKEDLQNLTKINLTANKLNKIPNCFNDLKNIEIIVLNNNKIEVIENLDNLTKLKRLELRGNKIKKIQGLEHNKDLELLTLSSNLITKINKDDFPEDPFNNMKELGLFGNYLGDENNEEENLNQLKELASLLAEKFPNITALYIGGNHFCIINEVNTLLKKLIPTVTNIDGKNIK